MSSRLSFVKKHLVIEHLQKAEKDSGIFVVAIEKTQFPKNYNPGDHVSGSAILAQSMKGAVQKAKLAPESLEVIVMGSSLLATGQMPALTDNFSVLFGTTLGTYIMNNSSGLQPLFQSIKQIKFNKKSIVALGSLQKPKQNDSQGLTGEIQFREIRKQQNQSSEAKNNNSNNLWKLTQKEKQNFIRSLRTQEAPGNGKKYMDFNFQEPSDNDSTITRGGACSLILMSGERLSRGQNLQPLAKILAYSQSPINPSDILLSLFSSINICLQRARLTIQEIDYFQFREQYPIIPLAFSKMFKIDKNKINVHHQMMTIGGPSKVNGAGVVANIISLMKEKGGKFGLAGICNQNGISTSIIIANVLTVAEKK